MVDAHPSVAKASSVFAQRVDSAEQEADLEPRPDPAAKPRRPRPPTAAIPPPPPNYETFPSYWHYGWIMSLDDVKDFLRRHSPYELASEKTAEGWITSLEACAAFETSYPCVRHVLVPRAPDMPVEWRTGFDQGPTTDERVSFFMITSTASRVLFKRRPLQTQLDKLISMFGKEPCWMMDAFFKSDFDELFQFERTQAAIPPPPPDYKTTPGYWHFGWLMPIDEIKAFLQRHSPAALRSSLPEDDPDFDYGDWMTSVQAIAGFRSNYLAIRHVLVPRTEDMPIEWRTYLQVDPPNDDRVSFLMIVSTASRGMFLCRPTQAEFDKLKDMFGREPCWMQDAFTKREFKAEFDFEF
ncbi:hypothetical protein GGG16DRAFT_111494 [Schizophyllum commune]